jgi:hypothetical protein
MLRQHSRISMIQFCRGVLCALATLSAACSITDGPTEPSNQLQALATRPVGMQYPCYEDPENEACQEEYSPMPGGGIEASCSARYQEQCNYYNVRTAGGGAFDFIVQEIDRLKRHTMSDCVLMGQAAQYLYNDDKILGYDEYIWRYNARTGEYDWLEADWHRDTQYAHIHIGIRPRMDILSAMRHEMYHATHASTGDPDQDEDDANFAAFACE